MFLHMMAMDVIMKKIVDQSSCKRAQDEVGIFLTELFGAPPPPLKFKIIMVAHYLHLYNFMAVENLLETGIT